MMWLTWLQEGTNFTWDNFVVVDSYNIWQYKVVALSIPWCCAKLKCLKYMSDTVELLFSEILNKFLLHVLVFIHDLLVVSDIVSLKEFILCISFFRHSMCTVSKHYPLTRVLSLLLLSSKTVHDWVVICARSRHKTVHMTHFVLAALSVT